MKERPIKIYLLVSSGVTVQEFDGGAHHLGHLGRRNILLGSGFCTQNTSDWGPLLYDRLVFGS